MRRTCLALIVLALAGGCGGGPRPQPVSGQVRWKGKGLPGAVVVFHPPDGRPLSSVADEEGRFRLTPGAVPGSYGVTVVWRELKRDGDEVLRNGRNLLPARYEKPETSRLSATVKEGANDLAPFDLQ